MINIILISIISAFFLLFILIVIFITKNTAKIKNKIENYKKESGKSILTKEKKEKIKEELEKKEELERIRIEQETKIEEKNSQAELIENEDYTKTDYPQETFDKFKESIPSEKELINKEEFSDVVNKVVINPDELLKRFVRYVNRNKLTKIDDISNRLKTGKEETVDKLREIENHGNSVGFIDENGYYMNLNEKELSVRLIN